MFPCTLEQNNPPVPSEHWTSRRVFFVLKADGAVSAATAFKQLKVMPLQDVSATSCAAIRRIYCITEETFGHSPESSSNEQAKHKSRLAFSSYMLNEVTFRPKERLKTCSDVSVPDRM
jgi:hypothetical protein